MIVNALKQLRLNRYSILFIALSLLFVPSRSWAGSAFDGTFAHIAPGLVEYFSLTQAGDHVAGFFQAEQADNSSPGGMKETRINVSGVTDGDRVNLRQGEGPFSTTLGWDARSNGNGFSLTFPEAGGLLGTNQFHRADNDTINAAILSLRQSVGQARQQQATIQQRANVENELQDSRIRLQNNLNRRPSVLQDLISAKAEVTKAQKEIDDANGEIIAKQSIVDRLEAAANAADASAITPEDHGHVNEMRGDVNSARGDVNAARGNLNAANGGMNAAQAGLRIARNELTQFDNRIAELRSIIQRDTAYLRTH